MTALINISPASEALSARIAASLDAEIVPLASLCADTFAAKKAWIFVGAMGICVRSVATFLRDKYSDPAVVCVDAGGRWAVPVAGGHVGGANDLARRIAELIGAEAVVTTLSDGAGLWPLDTLGARFGWTTQPVGATMNEPVGANANEPAGATMNDIIARFVARRPTALLIETRGGGASWLEATAPAHVSICYRQEDIQPDAELVIALSPRAVHHAGPVLRFVPRVLALGVGCRKGADADPRHIARALLDRGWLPQAVGTVATVELKKDEPFIAKVAAHFGAPLKVFSAEELASVEVPNPSENALRATGSPSVAEAAARLAAHRGELVIEKQRGGAADESANNFTFALAEDALQARRGHIEIVGAGPGDPDLISVRGRELLEQADLILYAGSLVPRALTACAKPSAAVRSSADMTLDEQVALMHEFYQKGCLVVRLHTGDPCIYGAIEEQMALMDARGMSYRITPGISSFQAAAAELRSQFTIPERVQSIILTRGGGRTPMPPGEQLSELARSRSTMCIFLSAGIAADVQRELLEHYPPATPVAVCHHLTWPDQRIWRGELSDLAKIVEQNNLTLTTMIVVGEAIGNRSGRSRLYSNNFKHLFRQ